ncbi:MAG: adenylate kinase family protein [Candidatus Bathyarchaeota archaeon]|nr:adenylate kinase family protein [Candidatus Bathyarchaeota archaeon]
MHIRGVSVNYLQTPKGTMSKRVILVTGTPAVGKSTLATKLAQQLNGQYINLTELAKTGHLTLSEDKQRNTTVIDEAKMRRELKTIINRAETDLVIDGHYAAAVTPKTAVTHVFVLRRNPQQLQEIMQKRGYSQTKQQENAEAEILDVCLVEALQKQPTARVCEIDATNKTPTEVLTEAIEIIEKKRPCQANGVDWLGKLEREGKLDQYLKT